MKNEKIQKLTILFAVLCFAVIAKGQNKPIFSNSALSNFLTDKPAELVYLQTDRELYSDIDTLWFKIYLVDAHSHIPEIGLRNVYVELISNSGAIVMQNLILVEDGFGNGEIVFSDYSAVKGTFELRASTNYQKNFSDELIFKKYIKVEQVNNRNPGSMAQTEKNNNRSAIDNPDAIDLQFLPEGGYLTSNLQNNLAFKAINSKGKSIEVSGNIKDETGKTVAKFQTSHNGMGKLRFFSQKDKIYSAIINGYPNLEFKIPESTDKVQFSVGTQNDSIIIFNLVEHSIPKSKKKYYLINSQHGKISFYLPLETTNFFIRFKLNRSNFGLGINQLTLSDENLHPLAERLIFIKNDEILSILVEPEKVEYTNREKVNVDISTFVGSENVAANLLVSVVNQNQAVSLDEHPQNILSYLLLDAELKGKIENPSYYFSNDSADTNQNLDLLMLTQGWRTYNWNEFLADLPRSKYEKERGLVVRGKLKRLFGKKGAENGKLTLLMKDKLGKIYFNETQSDSLGNFFFPPTFFPDSMIAFIQGLNKKDKNNTEIQNVVSFSPPAYLNKQSLNFSTFEEVQKTDFLRSAYKRLAYDKEFNPGKYNILLDEIEVVEKLNPFQEEDDGHMRMYGKADAVLVIDDTSLGYSDIWSYISGRVAGVTVSGNSVTIRGATSFTEGGNTPHFLLDGIPVDKETLDGIPLIMVDKIEVLKNVSNLAVFGMRGANGVIAVYTKRGEIYEEEKFYTGIINHTLRGYYSARKFYSPNYEVETLEKPDNRATLLWSPNVNTGNMGKSTFSFFMTDDSDPVLIKVEGISSEGKPGVGFVKLIKK